MQPSLPFSGLIAFTSNSRILLSLHYCYCCCTAITTATATTARRRCNRQWSPASCNVDVSFDQFWAICTVQYHAYAHTLSPTLLRWCEKLLCVQDAGTFTKYHMVNPSTTFDNPTTHLELYFLAQATISWIPMWTRVSLPYFSSRFTIHHTGRRVPLSRVNA